MTDQQENSLLGEESAEGPGSELGPPETGERKSDNEHNAMDSDKDLGSKHGTSQGIVPSVESGTVIDAQPGEEADKEVPKGHTENESPRRDEESENERLVTKESEATQNSSVADSNRESNSDESNSNTVKSAEPR